MKKPKLFVADEIDPWPLAGFDPLKLPPFVTIHKSEACGKTEDLCRTLGLHPVKAGRFVAVSTPYMRPQSDD